MNPQAIKRHERRREVFIREGLSEKEAFDLAEKMYDRDQDPGDDRRLCFECQHYTGKVCMKMRDKAGKYQQPLRFILQRCEFFTLKEVK